MSEVVTGIDDSLVISGGKAARSPISGGERYSIIDEVGFCHREVGSDLVSVDGYKAAFPLSGTGSNLAVTETDEQ